MSQTKAQLLDPVDLTIVTDDIANGAINNAKVNASAAIARSKLANVDLVDDTSPQLGGTLDANGQVISFPDSNGSNNQVRFGTGNDLLMYHQSNSSYIINNTGNLNIGSNNEVRIKGGFDVAEHMGRFIDNGAVELYYDASKKFETSSAGVAVSGDIYLSGELNLTNGSDAQRFIDAAVGSSALTLRGTTSNDANHQIMARFFRGGACELNHNGTKKLETTSGGATVSGRLDTQGLFTGDNTRILVGDGDDLQLLHDGSRSSINNRTGELRVLANNNIRLGYASASNTTSAVENYAIFNYNGSNELYYDNSKKVETTTNGAKVESGTANFEVYSSTDDEDAKITIIGKTASGGVGQAGRVEIVGESTNNSNGASAMHLRTRKTNNTVTTAITIDSSQDVTLPIDDQKLRFGASQDLQIYHDGSHSRIDNQTGALFLRNNTGTYNGEPIKIQPLSGEDSVLCVPNGRVELHFDNSKKLETTSGGIAITGRLDCTQGIDIDANNQAFRVGASQNLQLDYTGSEARIRQLDASNSLRIMVRDGAETAALFNPNGAVELYYDNIKKFETLTNGVQVTGSAIVDGTGTQTTTVIVKNGTDTDGTRLGHSSNSDRGFIQVTESGADFGIQVGGANTSNMRLELFGDSTTASRICLGTEEMITAAPNGAVELYFDNSSKLRTNTGGADVTGDFGISGELNMTADGNKNRFIDCSLDDGEALFIRSTQGGDANHENMALFLRNQQVELYYDNVKRLNTSTSGIEIAGILYVGQGHAVNVMNRESNGTLLEFQTTGTARGSISVSGNTVSYNGGHLSRWSQIKGLSTTDKSARPTLYKGTVLSNLDDLCVWTSKEPEQLNMTKVSDTVGDKDVAGVFLGWDENNSVEVNDLYISMTGDMVIRVAGSTTVARGDLLISAGDGTAKPQADDIVRSSTIAKITSTIPTTTYADGSKAYPCVLMAC